MSYSEHLTCEGYGEEITEPKYQGIQARSVGL